MSRNTIYICSGVLAVLSLFVTAIGAPGLAAVLFCVSIGLAAAGCQTSEQHVHYHFHGEQAEKIAEEKRQEALKSCVEATEQTVTLPDGRVATQRKVIKWQ